MLRRASSGKLDENGKIIYNSSVKKESRLEIVIGLPVSGKSSTIVDVL